MTFGIKKKGKDYIFPLIFFKKYIIIYIEKIKKGNLDKDFGEYYGFY